MTSKILSNDQLLQFNELNGTEDCVGDLLQVQLQQEPQYPMIEVEKIETISNVEQQQDVQQVQQHPEQIKQMYDKVYMEVAGVDRSRHIMWKPVIQQEILQMKQRRLFPLSAHIETDYDDLPELIHEYSEEILGPDIFKIQLLDRSDYFSRASGGPVMEELIEPYVTHWQELENQDQVQQRQEQEEHDFNLSEHDEEIGGDDHNFRHGADYSYSVD